MIILYINILKKRMIQDTIGIVQKWYRSDKIDLQKIISHRLQ